MTTYQASYVDDHGYEHRYNQHQHDDDETVVCFYCHTDVPGCESCPPPPEGDDSAWAELAKSHSHDCEWLITRAHRREIP